MIKVYGFGYRKIECEFFTFNGGEEHVKIKGEIDPVITIEAFIRNSNDIMKLLLVTDALRRIGPGFMRLILPYVPYARQDRVMVPGESLSIKVFCDLINSQNYNVVRTLDNHSPVSTALLNKCYEIDIMPLIKQVPIHGNTILISPDEGARKKIWAIGNKLDLAVAGCSKIRNPHTGEIIHTEIKCDNFKGKDCLIIDDICDGGRTFIEIAKILKDRGAETVRLFVSHGIFSKGLGVFDGLISSIYSVTLWDEKILEVYKYRQIKLIKEDL
jgi:ribose-phosphate pyrophosphokinase